MTLGPTQLPSDPPGGPSEVGETFLAKLADPLIPDALSDLGAISVPLRHVVPLSLQLLSIVALLARRGQPGERKTTDVVSESEAVARVRRIYDDTMAMMEERIEWAEDECEALRERLDDQGRDSTRLRRDLAVLKEVHRRERARNAIRSHLTAARITACRAEMEAGYGRGHRARAEFRRHYEAGYDGRELPKQGKARLAYLAGRQDHLATLHLLSLRDQGELDEAALRLAHERPDLSPGDVASRAIAAEHARILPAVAAQYEAIARELAEEAEVDASARAS